MNTIRCTSLWGLAAIACFALAPSPALAKAPIKMKTIQSLADGSRGLYLAVDNATGAVTMQEQSDIATSGTWWELDDEYFELHRSYLTHRVRNRGNNSVNGQPLVSHADGSLTFAALDELDESQRWIVRYVGLYKGYHAFFIQNTNMEFLTLEGGAVKSARALSPGAYWHVAPGPSLPTDQIR